MEVTLTPGMRDTTYSERELPWHQVGTTFDVPHRTAAAAVRAAGLDFRVELRSVGYGNAADEWAESPRHRALVRVDTDEIYAVVGSQYRPAQNVDAFSFLDHLDARYVGAGQLQDGREVFVVVQLPHRLRYDFEFGGDADPTSAYLVVLLAHDLSRAVSVAALGLRERAMTQLALPTLSRTVPQRWAAGAEPGARNRVAPAEQRAAATLARFDAYADRVERLARQLVALRLPPDRAREVLRVALPKRPQAEQVVERVLALQTQDRSVGFAGTGWGLVQATNTYFEWARPDGHRTRASRFTGGLEGDTFKTTSRVVQLLQSFV